MGEFTVLVAGVPYGYQGDFSDGRWLTEEHRAQLRSVNRNIYLDEPSFRDVNAGYRPPNPAQAILVETSGAEPSWESLPGIVLGDPFRRLLGPDVEFVQSCSAGIEHLAPIVPKGLVLCNASGVHANAVAETVVSRILANAKMLYQRQVDQQAKVWRQLPCRELTNAVMCIVGTGHIGSAVARLAQGLGMKTVGVRRGPATARYFDSVVGADRLPEVLRETDYLIVACPLTDATRGLLGGAELAAIKSGAYLANVARGAIVEEAALLWALETGRLCGAFLDCFTEEPLPPDHPLWMMPTVEVSPHDSHASQFLGDHHVTLFCENLRRMFEGRALRNVVDLARGY